MAKQKGTSTKELTISKEDLREFADLLMLIRERYKSHYDWIVEASLSRLDKPKNTHPAFSLKAANNYIADIDIYLRKEKWELITPNDKTDKYKTKPSEKKKNKDSGDIDTRPIYQKLWIRDHLADLKECFTVFGKKTNEGRAVLKELNDDERIYTVYFWQWTKYDDQNRELEGVVREGKLTIWGNWLIARFSTEEDGKMLDYEADITLRRYKEYKTYYIPLRVTKADSYDHPLLANEDQQPSSTETKNGNQDLTIDEKGGKRKRKVKSQVANANELFVVLSVWNHNSDSVLTGTFAGSDIDHGYPAMGKIFLVRDTVIEEASHALVPDIDKHSDPDATALTIPNGVSDIASFGRNYVTYQTTLLRYSSVESLDKIPHFGAWREAKKLFEQPLHGYFLKTESSAKESFRFVHFTLTVDLQSVTPSSCQAIITYQGLTKDTSDRGYITIEEPSEGSVVFRGEFDYRRQLNRFRYTIMFTKARQGDSWYFGSIEGLNRKFDTLLTGRFALRSDPLDNYSLEIDQLEKLLQDQPVLADFLLEINQEIPTSTIQLYNRLHWPFLPNPKHTGNPFQFDEVLHGEFGCYALVREKIANTKPVQYRFVVARYPLKIEEDGRAEMKFETPKNRKGISATVKYYGRAFHNSNPPNLFLYFDTRVEGQKREWLHLSMYFGIKTNNPISKAFGVSNRFVHTENFPEARVEVLIPLPDALPDDKKSPYDKTDYKTYDPFNQAEINELNEQSAGLGTYLAGRANRILILSSHLHPNDKEAIPTRRDSFRRLHIRAALYEIQRKNPPEESLTLLDDAFLHGFGSGSSDRTYLISELNSLKSMLDGRDEILSKIEKLWPGVWASVQKRSTS